MKSPSPYGAPPKPARTRARAAQVPLTAATVMTSVSLEAVMSFLKETRGAPTWTTGDLSESLKIREAESKATIGILVLQGYVKKSVEDGEWITTIAGEAVSGSRPPRFALKRVEKALAELAQRIKSTNADRHSLFRIAKALAFGDFLLEHSLVQAADIGIEILPKNRYSTSTASLQDLMKKLRARSPLLHLRPYRRWMSARTHHTLI